MLNDNFIYPTDDFNFDFFQAQNAFFTPASFSYEFNFSTFDPLNFSPHVEWPSLSLDGHEKFEHGVFSNFDVAFTVPQLISPSDPLLIEPHSSTPSTFSTQISDS